MERLTLEGAIAHLDDILINKVWSCSECMNEHIALRSWLNKLKQYKDLEEQGKLMEIDVKDKLVKCFVKRFGVRTGSSPVGSCTDDFLLNHAIKMLDIVDISKEDKKNLAEAFTANMYHSLGRFSNGDHAGRKYISIIEAYFNRNIAQDE